MGHPNNSKEFQHLSIPVPGPGSPRKYGSPEEMQIAIDKYFASCWEEDWREEYIGDSKEKQWVQKFDHEGNPVMKLKERPTVTGLALALGFTTRLSLINYQHKDEFAPIVEQAKLKVEYYYEHGGADGEIHPATTIFALKNFGWTDTIQITGKNADERLTPEEIAVQIEAAKKKVIEPREIENV
ncbi:MAG: terminase small subunit [Eubacteriales bacterium]|nr:terminase small subunit [Eubacteriales bacterium]